MSVGVILLSKSCTWLASHLKQEVISNLPAKAVVTRVSGQLPTQRGPETLEMLWDTQYMGLPNMIQDLWESQASAGMTWSTSCGTSPVCGQLEMLWDTQYMGLSNIIKDL